MNPRRIRASWMLISGRPALKCTEFAMPISRAHNIGSLEMTFASSGMPASESRLRASTLGTSGDNGGSLFNAIASVMDISSASRGGAVSGWARADWVMGSRSSDSTRRAPTLHATGPNVWHRFGWRGQTPQCKQISSAEKGSIP